MHYPNLSRPAITAHKMPRSCRNAIPWRNQCPTATTPGSAATAPGAQHRFQARIWTCMMSVKPQSRSDSSITSDQNLPRMVFIPHQDIKRPTLGDRLNAKTGRVRGGVNIDVKTLCKILTVADAMPLPMAGPRVHRKLSRHGSVRLSLQRDGSRTKADYHGVTAMPLGR